MTHAFERRAAGAAITLCLALGLSLLAPLPAGAAPADSAPPAGEPVAAPAAQTGTADATGTLQAAEPDGTGAASDLAAPAPAPAPPLTANPAVHRTEAGAPVEVPARPSAQGTTGAAGAAGPGGADASGEAGTDGTAAEACEVSTFAQASGAALVDAVKGHSTECINSLFPLTGSDAGAVFAESKMVAVANALRDVAQGYPGDNSTSAGQLVLFLRAGYYVQWYNADAVGEYGQALSNATAGALDAFFASPRSRDVSDANGETLGEAVTLIDSAGLNDRYLDVVTRLLTAYDDEYAASWWMRNAVNNTFTVLFRGHQVPAFVQKVAGDPSLLTTLRDFAVAHLDLVGGDSSFLPTNAGRELARFLGDASVRPAAKPLVKDLLGRTSLDDATAPLYVALAGMVQYYEPDACADYGTCDIAERVAAKVLTVNRVCSPTITIRAQQMTAAELDASCASLLAQDEYFHAVAKDPGPVPNDVNSEIEVVVFDSSYDYQDYAGIVFGIDTNNGGMYLEGDDPSSADNVARFIAYEAEWLRPEFAVWNLNHEYTHFLDGRFDMHGNFEEGMLTPTIWWVEGFAEYISYHYRGEAYTAAQQAAALGTYTLSELFDTGYGDQERVYRWGYLAVAFMLNEHPAELQTILGSYRAGEWDAARTYITDTIGTRYDAEFAAYLTRCAAGDCSAELGGGDGGTPVNRAPVASFTVATEGLNAIFADASSDVDGTVASWRWAFGDGRESTEQHPSIAYSAAGDYTVTLTVTDDDGATASSSQTISVSDSSTPGLPECTAGDDRVLDNGCVRTGRNAATGQIDYLLIWVPEHTPRVTVTATGGTGNADLYFDCYGWATPNSHVARSTNPDNEEQVVVDWPATGWNYVSLVGVTDFAGVTLTASY